MLLALAMLTTTEPSLSIQMTNRSQSGVRHVYRALALLLITYLCRDEMAFTRTYKMLEPANTKVRRVVKYMTLI